MSAPEEQAPNAGNDANGGDDNNHQEVAEILTDLVQNQMAISSADATQVAEAQTTALQQLLQTGGTSAMKQQTVQALLDAAMKGDAGEKKQHAFWDTQVSITYAHVLREHRTIFKHLNTLINQHLCCNQTM